MKIVFMGTPEFSVPSLEILVKYYDVCAVFTQPDRPKGRGKKLCMSEVKETALKYNIPVYQPQRLKNNKDAFNIIKNLNPDYIVVVAFGQILPKEILDIPKYGCINLHASLLPKYRGAAPINWVIINGENITGNTTMLMNEGLDTGDILLQNTVKIDEDMTAGDLHDVLKEDGAKLLLKTVNDYSDKKIIPQKQKDCESTYVSMLNKDMAHINWNNCYKQIYNMIRGLNPWPVAYTQYNNKMMKIYEADFVEDISKEKPGCILKADKDGIKVSALNGCIIIKKIQFPGGKVLNVSQYIIGNKIEEGEVLK